METRAHTNPDGSVVEIFVGDYAHIGRGVYIGNDAHIGKNAHIGNDARIGDYARIGNGAIVGDDAHIGKNALIGKNAHIGNEARVGDVARICNGAKTLQPIYIARLGDDRDGWRVTLTREYLQIGCKFHPTADWWGFDDATIAKMDRAALRWWRKYKPVLVAMARANGWTDGMEELK